MLYGYELSGGKTVINEEEAAKLKKMIKGYLEGKSIALAGKDAGISKSASALRRMLSNPNYLGNRYYPAILTKRTYNRVQKTLAARSHAATRNADEPAPVYSEFSYSDLPADPEGLSATAAAEQIYRSVTPKTLSID